MPVTGTYFICSMLLRLLLKLGCWRLLKFQRVNFWRQRYSTLPAKKVCSTAWLNSMILPAI